MSFKSFEKIETRHPRIILMIIAGVLFLDEILKIASYEKRSAQKNYGALFSLDIDCRWTIVAIVLAIIFYIFSSKDKRKINAFIPCAMIAAGIQGNLIDRIRLGFIIDYINLFDLFIFNLADLLILLGSMILFWRIIKE